MWCILGNHWLRMKSINFDFSAKSSSTDYNELNKPTPMSLAHIGFEKSLVELGVPKIELLHFFHFSLNWKIYFSPRAMGRVKSSSTDHKESNKPNSKFLANHLSNFEFQKMSFFTFFHIFCSTEKFTFSL